MFKLFFDYLSADVLSEGAVKSSSESCRIPPYMRLYGICRTIYIICRITRLFCWMVVNLSADVLSERVVESSCESQHKFLASASAGW